MWWEWCRSSVRFCLMSEISLFMCYMFLRHAYFFSYMYPELCLGRFVICCCHYISFFIYAADLASCASLLILPFPLPDGQSRNRERGRRGERWQTAWQSIQVSLGGLCPSCLPSTCHNNNSKCKAKAHRHTEERCTFEHLMKPLLQPPTNHLVLWFCSDAFYKHRPGEYGEQVLHILSGSCSRFNTLVLTLCASFQLFFPLRNPLDHCSLFPCQWQGTNTVKYWLRIGSGLAPVPYQTTLDLIHCSPCSKTIQPISICYSLCQEEAK